MTQRSIEVRDPDPPPTPEGAPSGAESPYKNLLVPLVVVPFMVVGVLVLVFVFFGAVTGHEASIDENLQRVVDGGSNESKQAAVSLVSQVLANREALAKGQAPPWPVEPDFVDKLRKAWDDVPQGEKSHRIRLALAQLSAQYGDPQAFEKLAYFVQLPDDQDPDAQLRLYAMFALTWLGDERARGLVIPLLRHADPYLRQNAAAALQKMPGEDTRAALKPLLDDPSLELRGQAAISLSHLGDAAGAAVLVELLDPASYAAAHAREPKKYASDKVIQDSRRRALDALARLRRAEDRALFERLAADDLDPLIREAAMLAVAKR